MSLSHVHGRSPRGTTTIMPVISPGLDIATKMKTGPVGFGGGDIGRKSPVLGLGAARRRADQQPAAGMYHLARGCVTQSHDRVDQASHCHPHCYHHPPPPPPPPLILLLLLGPAILYSSATSEAEATLSTTAEPISLKPLPSFLPMSGTSEG
jgi:hypothetical protein